MKTILLCSDLDRTLIPNGEQEESPFAREFLRRVAARPELCLAYVSGRGRELVREAMAEFELPEPDFVIGDVGTTFYGVQRGEWQFDEAWQEAIGVDWLGLRGENIVELLAGRGGLNLELQPQSKQNRYKVSYYTAFDCDGGVLKERVLTVLGKENIRATVIWSRDEAKRRGLLDILPQRANKLQAIRYLINRLGIDEDRVVFAGDSGNDLDALTSGLPAILVRNSSGDVRGAALETLAKTGQQRKLYQAGGGKWGMNGHYSAGVLEGLAHFFPEAAEWLEAARKDVDDHW